MQPEKILPEALDILRRSVEPRTNGKVHTTPAHRRVDAERLIGMALERVGSDGRNNAGFWLAVQLRDNAYGLFEAEAALRSFRGHCPHSNTKGEIDYTEQEIQASLREAYSRAAREPWSRKHMSGAPPTTHEDPGGPENSSPPAAEPRSEQSGEKPKAKKTATSDSSAFRLTDDAVIYVDRDDPDKEPLRICGRLEVAALTRDEKGNAWGCLLRWRDREGRLHEWAMPYSLLAGDGTEVRARLMDEGLVIAPGRKARELLPIYLQTARPEKLALCVARIGWHGDSFVLPGATIGPKGAEPVFFQTAFEAEHYLNIRGSVEEWRDHVGRHCSGNSRLILTVSCGFAGPVLHLGGGESGGIHFVGQSSTGKTTTLVVGGSVLGGGGQNGFVQTWRATANGLEAVAESHNHISLFLDELAQVDAHEAAEIAYLLSNGTGKSRMTRTIGARRSLRWNLLFVSAGEVTLADHAQTAGRRVKGGALVRLLNVDADASAGLGLFEDLHGAESADAFARQLKDAAERFYGAPLRAYLDALTKNLAGAKAAICNFKADFLARHVPAGALGEVYRAAQRLALIAAAGELATGYGITGWEPGEAIAAAARCFESWIASRGTTGAGDTEAAIRQVRAFIEAHGSSRFQAAKARLDGHGEPILERVINRAGFRVEEEGSVVEYLILPEVFNGEVSKGFNPQMVARALRDRGYLNTQPPHLTKKRPLPEVGDVRVYAVRPEILEA